MAMYDLFAVLSCSRKEGIRVDCSTAQQAGDGLRERKADRPPAAWRCYTGFERQGIGVVLTERYAKSLSSPEAWTRTESFRRSTAQQVDSTDTGLSHAASLGTIRVEARCG